MAKILTANFRKLNKLSLGDLKMHIYIKHYFQLGALSLFIGVILSWLLNDPGRYVYFLIFLGIGLLMAAFIRPNENANY